MGRETITCHPILCEVFPMMKNCFCNETQQLQNFSWQDSASGTQTSGLPTSRIMSPDLHYLHETNPIGKLRRQPFIVNFTFEI